MSGQIWKTSIGTNEIGFTSQYSVDFFARKNMRAARNMEASYSRPSLEK